MKREIRYLTYSEVQDIFEDVYATGWPSPKISSDGEKFALLIQKASMEINGVKIPVFEEDEK
jgi:hypothetical protein